MSFLNYLLDNGIEHKKKLETVAFPTSFYSFLKKNKILNISEVLSHKDFNEIEFQELIEEGRIVLLDNDVLIKG